MSTSYIITALSIKDSITLQPCDPFIVCASIKDNKIVYSDHIMRKPSSGNKENTRVPGSVCSAGRFGGVG